MACPSGYTCMDAGGTHVCVATSPPPPASGCGCAAHRTTNAWSTLGILAALGLVLRARRRAR